jgi:sugar lactone lactonase YvrE
MSAPVPIEILKVGNMVGEGVLWNWRRHQLWWTDIPGRRLYRYDWSSGHTETWSTPDRIGSFGLVENSERLITAFAGGIALYEPQQTTLDWIAQPADIVPGIRFNDGRVDRSGRFWAGTMVENGSPAQGASLYSISRTGAVNRVQRHFSGIAISNGLCSSPDGALLYFADSPTHTIRVFDLIEPEGTLGASRVFAQTPDGSDPDGAAIDEDGCLWSAHWGGGCIVRYTPDGRIDRTLKVPTRQPTCVCFAGDDLDVLCVTSAREGLTEEILREEPHAGDVFFYRTGVRGLPEPEYRL